MFIRQITIEGVEGDIEITRIDGGALVTQGVKVLCEMRRDEDAEIRRLKVIEVAKAVYGTDRFATRRGFVPGRGPRCTGSMIDDLRCEIERIADC